MGDTQWLLKMPGSQLRSVTMWVSTYFLSTIQHVHIGLQISAATCMMCYHI